jgi:LysM repeat protein
MTAVRQHLALLLLLLGCLAFTGCEGRSARGERARPAQPPVEHVVAAGDTLSSIATAYGVAIGTIVEANHLRDRSLRPGQRLVIPGGKPPHEEPVVTQAEPPGEPAKPASDWFVPRSQWALEPVILNRTKPMGGTPTRITVHHSGDAKDAGMDPLEWLRVVDHQHMLGLGKAEPWACIGYHFIVAPDGRVFEGRPLQYQGAHAGWDEVNRLNIGICLIGDFENHHVPAAQREALIAVLDRLCQDYGISRAEVFGHRHFKVTECPGRFLSAIVDAYARSDRAAPAASRLAASLAAP